MRTATRPAAATDSKQKGKMHMQAQLGATAEPRSSQRTGGDYVTEQVAETTPAYLARIAGALYLLVIVGGAFASGYVPGVLVVSGNAAATTHNILAQQEMYRLSLAIHIF